MKFFCPVCQLIIEAQPETTITTKLGQAAQKTHCPTCNQDLAAVSAALPVTIAS